MSRISAMKWIWEGVGINVVKFIIIIDIKISLHHMYTYLTYCVLAIIYRYYLHPSVIFNRIMFLMYQHSFIVIFLHIKLVCTLHI